MNLVTNDVSGLFLIPLGSNLAANAWELMTSVGIVFIPFVVLFVKAFFEARAQGADEGSPAILWIQNIEKGFYGYVVILVFVVGPLSSPINMSYNQFSCQDNPSLVANVATSSNAASQGALSALGISPNYSPSLLFGLVHNVSTAINETMISKLSCEKGATSHEVSEFVSTLMPKTESVYRSILSFNQQCYAVARENIAKAQAENKPLRYSTGHNNSFSFYPPDSLSYTTYNGAGVGLMLGAYDSAFITGVTGTPLGMEVPETWFNQVDVNKTLKCSRLAEDLFLKLSSDLTSKPTYQDNLNKTVSFLSIMNPSIDPNEVKYNLVIQIYESALNPDPSREILWEDANKGQKSRWGTSVPALNAFLDMIMLPSEYGSSAFKRAEDGDSMFARFNSSIVGFGALASTVYESAKSYAVVLVAPLLVLVIQTILLTTLPILTVISGYSVKFIYNWILLYFSISLVPFWVNVAINVETLLLSLVNYSQSLIGQNAQNQTTVSDEMFLVASTAAMFVYLFPMIWIMLVQIIGNIAGSAFMTSVAGAAAVGQVGAEGMTQVVSDTAKTGYKEGKKAIDERIKNENASAWKNPSKGARPSQKGGNTQVDNNKWRA